MNKLFIKKSLLLALLLFIFPSSAHAAKMALYPGQGELKGGCVNKVDITLNTEGQNAAATDAFLSYNPNEIEIIDQSGAGGVQIRAGGLFQSYPGNVVSNGVIRLTAFNRSGFFKGSGTLASIYFKNKPGIEKASIYFSYSPGSTTDSNVADPDSKDILNGAYGGTYTFKTVEACYVDKMPPVVTKRYPEAEAIMAPLDTNIAIIITDDSSGVNIDTVTVDVDGKVYTKTGESRFTYSGYPTKYKIEIDPEEDFLPNTPVKVGISAEDMNKNAMSEYYAFNKMMLVEECRPSAPEEECGGEEKVCPEGEDICEEDEKVCPEEVVCPEPQICGEPEICGEPGICPSQKICPCVRPAAPSQFPFSCLTIIIYLLILIFLIVSILFNRYLWKKLKKPKSAAKKVKRSALKNSRKKQEGMSEPKPIANVSKQEAPDRDRRARSSNWVPDVKSDDGSDSGTSALM